MQEILRWLETNENNKEQRKIFGNKKVKNAKTITLVFGVQI